MKRILPFVVSLSAFSLIPGPTPLFAQDAVTVRTSARDDFSRVVFDWKGDVTYTLDESGTGKVVLKFSKPSKVNMGGADFSVFRATPAPQVLSENPLTLAFQIPEGVKVRAFDARGRVYLDVYDKGQKAAPKPEAQAQAKPVTPTPSAPRVKLVFEPEFKKAPPPAKAASLPAVPPVAVPTPEQLDTAQTAANQKTLEKQADQNQHVVSVTATETVDVAVFENYGALVWVLDQDAVHLIPSVSGPTPKIFGGFASEAITGGRIFTAKVPDGLSVKAQGGGLLWRLIFGKTLQKASYIDFERGSETAAGLRGGKLIWPVKDAGVILDVPDPVTGQILKVVTVKDAAQFAGPARGYVDFDVLHSPIGLVIRPKVDDLVLAKTERGVEISRPEGLALSDEKMSALYHMKSASKPLELEPKKTADGQPPEQGISRQRKDVGKPSIFRFSDWKIGGLETLNQNKNLILASLHNKEKPQQIEDLMTLAKMHLAHGRGAEALGFLEYALREMPELEKNPEFLALRGVARAFDWKSEVAFDDLSHPDLKPYDEIAYWRAFVLADLGDWQQAAAILPQDYSYLFDYPELIADRLALTLAEVNLRGGKIKIAEDLLGLIEKNEEASGQSMTSAIKYLQGEVHRQKNEKDKTEKIWGDLTQDADDFYRARAGLALTRLLREQKKINNKDAIDRLERLRYAWRGDELEAQINYWLGHAYFEDKDYVKGLGIMRDAASIAADTVLGKRIAQEMRETFSDIFLKARLSGVSALDSVAMYEQFTELTPAGADGDRLVQTLAEHLVKADLLERAARLLQHQVDHRVQGEEKARVALRLAVIYLSDRQPKRAIRALSAAVKTIQTLPADSPYKNQKQREIKLLSARAYAQADMGDRALAILKDMPKDDAVSRLKADIAWQAGYWPDAAEALNDVILNENIPLTRPPTADQTALIMNQAIALNLANDRVALANLRGKFKDLMLQTPRANQFELITRPRRDTELADKETLMSIMSEVDLFKNFLDSYKSEGAPPTEEKPPQAPPPAAAPAPTTTPQEG